MDALQSTPQQRVLLVRQLLPAVVLLRALPAQVVMRLLQST